jgi:hypothetical protein
MSDLASSCEYLTSEKTCFAVSESEKARTIRKVRCRNDEKMTCCYLCMFVLDCPTPCKFLGNGENERRQIDQDEALIIRSTVNEEKLGDDKTENTSVTYCTACDAETLQTRTKLKIDGWKGQKPTDSMQFDVEVLPVIVYLCPKCGKIDFRSEEKIDRR